MIALTKPKEVSIAVLKPTIDSIVYCKKFCLSKQEIDELSIKNIENYEKIKKVWVEEALKYNAIIIMNKEVIPMNSVIIIDSDSNISSMSIEWFNKNYEIKEDERIVNIRKRIKQISSGLEFIGSPEYTELKNEIESYEKYIKDFFSL